MATRKYRKMRKSRKIKKTRSKRKTHFRRKKAGAIQENVFGGIDNALNTDYRFVVNLTPNTKYTRVI
jgi:hypothetical protein